MKNNLRLTISLREHSFITGNTLSIFYNSLKTKLKKKLKKGLNDAIDVYQFVSLMIFPIISSKIK